MKYSRSKVSIIIPTKNEAEGLQKVISSVKKYSHDIIIVDGHSKDNTREIVKKEHVRFYLDNKKGKGDAVRIGIKKAKNDVIVIVDADGSPMVKDIPKLVSPILEKKADMVISSRRTGGSYDFQMSLMGILRTMGSDFLTYLVNRKFNTNFSDILYSFRAVKKASFKRIKLCANTFDIEQEVLIKFLQKKMTVLEIPSRENARAWGKSKLKTIAGVYLFFKLLQQLYR